MTEPSTQNLFRVLDETWPPARFVDQPPWMLRAGAGGGQRVSAATAELHLIEADIDSAEAGMRALDQHPLFMLRPAEDLLDQWLEARNYEVVDPVAIYVMPTDPVMRDDAGTTVTNRWPPNPQTLSLWANGGIGQARIAVMERASEPKTALVATDEKETLGAAFIAISDSIAMLHALEVAPPARRRGLGKGLMQAASQWAASNGANWLSLMVTRANTPANELYRRLGMREVGAYHYRRAPKAKL
ncbi:MAG: GNAT family N-acetyltransferase [Boseongicola sp.]|nr:GNAT family N-acetyltransferase [Boseongicola sp.]NNJ68333.1 GNAT family N-acetyltransferase [Boseongicola sp.]